MERRQRSSALFDSVPRLTFEALSKIAAQLSVLAFIVLQLLVNPDMTPLLRRLTIVALIVGGTTARPGRYGNSIAWVWLAALAPALLRWLTSREGPVLDVVWMAGLSASLVRTGSWTNWSLPPVWGVFAGGWALTLSLAWPVLLAREIGFDVAVLWDANAINSWGMLSAPQSVSWLLFVVWTQLMGLLWLNAVAARSLRGTTGLVPAGLGLCAGTTLASLVAIYQGVVHLGFLSTEFWASLARATGTMLDANALGMCAALAGPVAFVALHTRGTKAATAIGTVVLAVNLGGVWVSGSRTAALCGAAGATGLVLALWTSSGASRRLLAATFLAVGVALALLVSVTGAVGPVRRLLELPATIGGALDVLFLRDAYGPTAFTMFWDYPLTGVGISAYQVLAPDYRRLLDGGTLPFDTAQNWWRHQLAELGLLGAAIPFAWSGAIAWIVVRGRYAAADRATIIVVRSLLAGIGLGSVLQVPTQNPLVLLWFFLLLGWLILLKQPHAQEGHPPRASMRAAWTTVALAALLYASAHLMLARGTLGVERRAVRAGRDYVVHAHALERRRGGSEFRWTRDRSRFVWPTKMQKLVIEVWAGHPDLKQRPVQVRVATRCGVLLDRSLANSTPVKVAVDLPLGVQAIEVVVDVSRTWRPSEYGSADERDLGVAVSKEFVSGDQPGLTPVPFPSCQVTGPRS